MNKYIVPICDCEDNFPFVASTSARSLEEAEQRLMRSFSSEWDLDIPADWDDFCDIALKNGYSIGEVYNIEEFE
jgi:hypothetical protein